MAVDFANPAAYPSLPAIAARGGFGQAERAREGREKGRTARTTGRPAFLGLLAGEARDEVETLPVSPETEAALLAEVREAGDALSRRPFPDEIKRYKAGVRRFMKYVVTNALDVRKHERRSRPDLKPRFSIEVIDGKLEQLAADLMTAQMPQIALLARIEEINGLLVDLTR